MDASFEDVNGDILIKFKNLLVEDEENEISVSGPQKFIYAFDNSVSEGYGPDSGKLVIDLSTGEFPAPPETGNDILLETIRL